MWGESGTVDETKIGAKSTVEELEHEVERRTVTSLDGDIEDGGHGH
jgi:hypothetical protein